MGVQFNGPSEGIPPQLVKNKSKAKEGQNNPERVDVNGNGQADNWEPIAKKLKDGKYQLYTTGKEGTSVAKQMIPIGKPTSLENLKIEKREADPGIFSVEYDTGRPGMQPSTTYFDENTGKVSNTITFGSDIRDPEGTWTQ